MSQWSDFYRKRINSSYQEYFENKYRPMLNIPCSYETVCEEGIGIGSVSKAIKKAGVKSHGIDNDDEIIELCKINNPGLVVDKDNIFTHVDRNSNVTCTHGVLEHFEDDDIRKILKKYNDNGIYSVHYVPLIGYGIPSFGDERLLSKEYWIDNFKPNAYYSFNQGKDLLLMFG